MEQLDTATADQLGTDTDRRRDLSRRWRLVPAAITPVEPTDIGAGLLGQRLGRGRTQFRQEIEAFLGARGSGTYTSFRRTLAGCFRELAATGEDDRQTVLIPAFCSPDYPDVIEEVGLDPVRYDVDPETLSFDETAVENGLRDDPLAVVAINVLGYGSRIADLAARCDDQETYLVEALGYALGTTYEHERLGTFGDCAVLNFQQGKPIPVGGGMVVSQNSDLVFSDSRGPPIGANVGTIAGYAALSHPRPYYVYSKVKAHLDAVGDVNALATTHAGSNAEQALEAPFSTMSNFQALIASRLFGRLEEHRQQRERTAQFYAEALSDCPRVGQVVPVPGLSKLQHVRFPLIAETEPLRDRIGNALDEAGIQTTKLYDWPALDPEQFPGGARLQRTILTLPTHPYVDDRDRRVAVDTVREVATDNEGSECSKTDWAHQSSTSL